LLSGANLDFAVNSAWTGGPDNYKREMKELVGVLKKQGVAAEIITDEQIRAGELWKYKSLYVLDTFAIDKKTFEKIRDFVQGGGLLVGICEVGRFQSGGWAPNWPFEEVFGLKTFILDEWGGGVSNDGFLYRQAVVTEDGKKDPLLKGFGEKIDFGSLSANIWATSPAGAKVLAEFPKHLKTVKQAGGNNKYETVDQPVDAVTLHHYGKGNSIFIATLVGGRKPGRLEDVPDLALLLKNSQAYVSGKIEKIMPPVPEPVLAYSQGGYLPGQKKKAVLSFDSGAAPRNPHFTIYQFPSGKKIFDGKCVAVDKPFWESKEWTADFSAVQNPGSYWIETEWTLGKAAKKIRSSVFDIDSLIYRLRLIPSQYSFFHDYRCGRRCHTDSPLPGGYHDATGDWSVRMWSMPHVVYGLARALEDDPSSVDDAREELTYAVDWCLKMQGENGEVWAGVVPPNEQSDNHVRPWEEKAARSVQKSDSQGHRLPYIAGMARAAKALKSIDPALSAKTLAAAAKSWTFTQKEIQKDPSRINDTGDMGNWIWASAELFRASEDPKYLEEAKTWATKQLERQHRNVGEVEGADVCGDFFDSDKKEQFGRHQYKTFHQLGIYAGLIDLHAALAPSDQLWWPVHAALERLVHGYFVPMSSVTPYGLVGKALERNDPKEKFQIRFFDNAKAWDGAHYGYNSDYLAEGLMALDYARQTGQPGLVSFAEDQVTWMLGNNPLGYSMVDGVGNRIAPMIDDKLGTGRVFGGIPNGFEGEGSKNLPVWGESWGSREYWLPHNAYFLPLISELQWRRNIFEPEAPFTWEIKPSGNKVTVSTPQKDLDDHHLELLVEGGTAASITPSIENERAVWTIDCAVTEPLILLLRDHEKPEVYVQKFLMKP